MKMKFISLIMLLVSMSGCAQHAGTNYITPAGFGSKTTDRATVISGIAAQDAAQVFASRGQSFDAVDPDDYRITPLDVLEVSVLGAQDLNRTVQVSSSGNITLPLIKTVRAGGMTPSQLENSIAGKLQVSYMQSPQVSIFVKEFNSQRITVDGAVMKPGIFPFSGQLSLMQAIALSQGVTTVADVSTVLVFRTVNGERSAARFDLKQIRTGQASDPFLKAGDIVMVDESSSKTMFRNIKEALPLLNVFQLFSL
jgi:polysaccharide biosynthesis/export protein